MPAKIFLDLGVSLVGLIDEELSRQTLAPLLEIHRTLNPHQLTINLSLTHPSFEMDHHGDERL
jgi:hypothetical protein